MRFREIERSGACRQQGLCGQVSAARLDPFLGDLIRHGVTPSKHAEDRPIAPLIGRSYRAFTLLSFSSLFQRRSGSTLVPSPSACAR